MNTKRRFANLFLIMITVVFLITGIILFMMYEATLRDSRFDLTETLENQVSIIQTAYSISKNKDQIIQLIHNSQQKYLGIGKTGEFTLAEKRNDSIVFLLAHRNISFSKLKSVAFDSNIAMPMRMALSGQTGTSVGRDYRNKKVLAAYIFIDELGWGAVEKIDLEEIQKPFISTLILIITLSFILVVIGSLMFIRITNPIIKELKDSEEKYRLLVEGQADLIVKSDREGNLLYISPSYCEKIGIPENELIGKKYMPLVHPDDLEYTLKAQESLWLPPHTSYTEIRVKIKDSWQWIAWSNRAILDNYGNVNEIVGVGRDISRQKESEIALRDSEERFRRIFEEGPLGMAISGEDFIFKKTNAAFQKMIGYSEKELCSLSFKDITHPDHILADTEAVKKLFRGELPIYHTEKRYNRKDGQTVWGASTLTAIFDKNKKFLYCLVMIENITARKNAEMTLLQQRHEVEKKNEEYLKLNEELNISVEKIQNINYELLKAKEKAEESDRLKMVFLSNISHEIRTPMNAIMGFSELLEKADITSEKQEKFTQIIRKRSTDLLTIINDILDISKIDAGQLSIFEAPCNLKDILKELQDYYDARIKLNNGKNVVFKVDDQLKNNEHNIKTDIIRLNQVITNLVDNAIKFTDKGSISLGCQLKDGAELYFYVKDSGIGIPKNKHEMIFERFRQVEESHKRQYGGTGLGLPICKGIVELMGGRIWLESDINQGSTFYFTLPYKPIFNNEQPDDLSIVKDYNWQNKSVLIIEDDRLSITYFKEILTKTKSKCLFANNGNEALTLFNSDSKIDVVLMDIRLPDIDGFELTKRFKSINPDVVIIAQTAYASEDDRIRCLEAGCDDYISKPINRDNLFLLLDKYFCQRSQV